MLTALDNCTDGTGMEIVISETSTMDSSNNNATLEVIVIVCCLFGGLLIGLAIVWASKRCNCIVYESNVNKITQDACVHPNVAPPVHVYDNNNVGWTAERMRSQSNTMTMTTTTANRSPSGSIVRFGEM